MYPAFTDVTSDKVVFAVVFVGFVADWAEVAEFVAFIAFFTKSLGTCNWWFTFLVPFASLIVCDWRWKLQLAAQADWAAITKPAFWWNLGEWWAQAMNMYSNITHFTYDNFVFVRCRMAYFTNLAIWTFPLQSTLFFRWLPLLFYQRCVEWWLMTACMVPFLAFVALKDIKLLFEICVLLTLLALFWSKRWADCGNVLYLMNIVCSLLLCLACLLLNFSNFTHKLSNTLFLTFFLVTTETASVVIRTFWAKWNLIFCKLQIRC